MPAREGPSRQSILRTLGVDREIQEAERATRRVIGHLTEAAEAAQLEINRIASEISRLTESHGDAEAKLRHIRNQLEELGYSRSERG